jgi:hypothetical protein
MAQTSQKSEPNWLARGAALGSIVGGLIGGVPMLSLGGPDKKLPWWPDAVLMALLCASVGVVVGLVVGLIGGAVIESFRKQRQRS